MPWWVKFLWACSRQCKKTTTTIYIWTDSAKKQQTIYIWTDSAKKQQTIYIWTDSAKKTTNNLHMDRQCKKQQQFTYGQTVQKKQQQQFTYGQTVQKKQQQQFTYGQTVQKKQQQQFTYGQTVQKKQQTIYIWTVHIYRLYRRQCAKYTYIYSVHTVYYKDTLNYQRHIHRMGTSALCTVSIHNVVYT